MTQTKLNLCAILVLSLAAASLCEHLITGDVSGKKLVYHSREHFKLIPFVKRVKSTFYNDPNQKNISGIMAYDNSHSDASAMITAGGVGFSFVNIRMKSERGQGLDYDIGIYSTDNKEIST